MGVGTINVGANTSHFNEGIIVSGSALNATSTDDTLIASGTIEIITVKDPQLKLSYDASNNVQFTVDASGDLTITPSATTGDKNIYIKGDLIIRDNDESKHLVQIYDSSDDGVIAGYANNSITTLIHANGRTYFNGGNLGIGTSTPDYPFHIYANTGSYAAFIDNDENNSGHGLKITSDGSGTGTNLLDVESGTTTVFRVRADGKVAIGLTADGGIPTQVEALTVDGDLSFRDYLKRRGDPDTYIGMPANNQMELVAGGVNFVALNRTSAGTGSFIINDSADDVDFTVESPGESKALYLHAGNEVFHINHGESSFKTKIHNTDGEAITVNDNGVIINDDGRANIDFRVETDNFAGAILVDGGSDQVILCSNSTAASAESAGSDTNLFISGAIDGKQNSTGVTVVGGDMYVSGGLYSTQNLYGKITQAYHFNGDSTEINTLYFAADGGSLIGFNFDKATCQFIAPFAGSVMKVMVRVASGDNAQNLTIGFLASSDSDATTNPTTNASQAFAITSSPTNLANQTRTADVSGDNWAIAAGDVCAVTCQRSAVGPGKINVTLLVEYEHTWG